MKVIVAKETGGASVFGPYDSFDEAALDMETVLADFDYRPEDVFIASVESIGPTPYERE